MQVKHRVATCSLPVPGPGQLPLVKPRCCTVSFHVANCGLGNSIAILPRQSLCALYSVSTAHLQPEGLDPFPQQFPRAWHVPLELPQIWVEEFMGSTLYCAASLAFLMASRKGRPHRSRRHPSPCCQLSACCHWSRQCTGCLNGPAAARGQSCVLKTHRIWLSANIICPCHVFKGVASPDSRAASLPVSQISLAFLAGPPVPCGQRCPELCQGFNLPDPW